MADPPKITPHDFDNMYPSENAPSPDVPATAPAAAATDPNAPAAPYDWQHTALDVAKAIPTQAAAAVIGLAGLPGTVGDVINRGFDYPVNAVRGAMGYDPLPPLKSPFSGAALQGDVEKLTGPFYQADTLPGQYLGTAAGFAVPGVGSKGTVAAKIFNTLVPAFASETAGQATKGSPLEPWARGVAGLAAPTTLAKMITPTAAATPRYQAAVNAIDRAGIPLTAGDRTGSKTIQWLEQNAGDMPLSSRKAQDLRQAQASAIDQAFTDRAFDPARMQAPSSKMGGLLPGQAALPAPIVMKKGTETLGDEYNRLSAANVLRSDPALQQGLLGRQTAYEANVLPSQRTGDVASVRNDIIDRLIQGQGQIPGDVYQSIRSRLGRQAAGTGDPELKLALEGMKHDMDAAMQRGLSPQDAQAWALNNQRYANMKQLEGVSATSGEHMSPAGIAASVRSGRTSQAARGLGDMDELARSLQMVVKPLPNSGTPARLGMQTLFSAPSILSSAAFGAAASPLGLLAAAGGVAAPHVASYLAMTRGGQRYLANQALPQRAVDVITNALIQQGATQPQSIMRQDEAAAAGEAQRRQDLIDAGLTPSTEQSFNLPQSLRMTIRPSDKTPR